MRVGLISDTHDLLRPEALAALRGSDHIIHAGDVCSARVLDELRALAPVTAVRGNNDRGPWASELATTELVKLGDAFVYAIHDIGELDIDPAAAGVHAVIFGHSHKPLVETRDGVLFVNPGSAGPRRFKLPIAVGELAIDGVSVSARIIELPAGASQRRERR
jgi:putative phosphoesterase